ncbi:hypothetical protein AMBR_MGDJBKAP_02033 [Leuconostoc pseudomesenteroides]|nr:hypothetical protein AMBR_MGDJBKAP_02033 [Leuconostoc pseudomesenteroides]
MALIYLRSVLIKIRHFFIRKQTEIYDWFRFKKDLRHKLNRTNSYILISHNLDGGGGAPSVLFEYAKYLRKQGEDVVLLAGRGGSLSTKAKGLGISCYQMGWLYKTYIRSIPELQTKGIIVCTIVCHSYVNELLRFSDKKILWWIHEEDKLLKEYEHYIPNDLTAKLHIFCGSDRIMQSLSKLRPDLHLDTLFYGCEDQLLAHKDYFKNYRHRNGEYVVTVIGRLCKRKNQLQLINAVKNLPAEISSRVVINLVTASWENEYKVKIEAEILKNKNIRIIGPIPSDELYKVYGESNLIVCPSTDDPLPVVVTNAMMFGSNYVVSSGTGQAKLISQGVDGWVYDVANTKELTEILLENIKNPHSNINSNARKLFLNYFSLERLHSIIYSFFAVDNGQKTVI